MLYEVIHNQETELKKLKAQLKEEKQVALSLQKQKKRKLGSNNRFEDVDPKIGSKEVTHENAIEMRKLKSQNDELVKSLNAKDLMIANITNEKDELIASIDKTIANRINIAEEEFVKIIESKFSTKWNNLKSYASATRLEDEESVKYTVKKQGGNQNTQSNERMLVMKLKNEELVEERNKKERECNIMIHGYNDLMNDDLFLNTFMETIGVTNAIKTAFRIGRTNDIKKRPIKLICHNMESKEKIMSNLWKLKDQAEFKGISVKDDFTIAERKIIQEHLKSAKERNEMEPEGSTWIWKVRGNPRTGLMLKKVLKTKPTSMDMLTTTNLENEAEHLEQPSPK